MWLYVRMSDTGYTSVSGYYDTEDEVLQERRGREIHTEYGIPPPTYIPVSGGHVIVNASGSLGNEFFQVVPPEKTPCALPWVYEIAKCKTSMGRTRPGKRFFMVTLELDSAAKPFHAKVSRVWSDSQQAAWEERLDLEGSVGSLDLEGGLSLLAIEFRIHFFCTNINKKCLRKNSVFYYNLAVEEIELLWERGYLEGDTLAERVRYLIESGLFYTYKSVYYNHDHHTQTKRTFIQFLFDAMDVYFKDCCKCRIKENIRPAPRTLKRRRPREIDPQTVRSSRVMMPDDFVFVDIEKAEKVRRRKIKERERAIRSLENRIREAEMNYEMGLNHRPEDANAIIRDDIDRMKAEKEYQEFLLREYVNPSRDFKEKSNAIVEKIHENERKNKEVLEHKAYIEFLKRNGLDRTLREDLRTHNTTVDQLRELPENERKEELLKYFMGVDTIRLMFELELVDQNKACELLKEGTHTDPSKSKVKRDDIVRLYNKGVISRSHKRELLSIVRRPREGGFQLQDLWAALQET